MPALRLPRVSVILWAAGALLAALWGAFLVWGVRLPTAEWAKILPGFDVAESAFGASPEGSVPKVVAIILGLSTVTLVGLAVIARNWETLQRPDVSVRVFAAAVAVACCAVLLQNLVGRTLQEPWYNVQTMMTNPASVPAFGQRLLLIWPAMLLKHLVPRLTYIQSFILVQAAAIVLSIYVMGEWSALFVGKNLGFLGQILLTLLLLPTMLAYQAHDIGVVFTYTFCFLFLYKRQFWLFGIMFCVAIFNHQNVVLLVPTAVTVMWGHERRSTIGWLAALCLAVYFSIHFILNQTLPIPQPHDVKVWWNMRQIAQAHRTMIYGVLLTVPWYAGAACVWRTANPFLKRASILLPMQMGMYWTYGNLNEARLFNGFLPILVGIYLCNVRDRFLRPET